MWPFFDQPHTYCLYNQSNLFLSFPRFSSQFQFYASLSLCTHSFGKVSWIQAQSSKVQHLHRNLYQIWHPKLIEIFNDIFLYKNLELIIFTYTAGFGWSLAWIWILSPCFGSTGRFNVKIDFSWIFDVIMKCFNSLINVFTVQSLISNWMRIVKYYSILNGNSHVKSIYQISMSWKIDDK